MGYFRLLPFLRPSRFLCIASAISSFSSSPPFFQESPNLRLFLPFASSSSAALQKPNPNLSYSNLFSEFLIRECGFSQSRLALLQKRHPLLWRRTTIDKVRQIVDIFRNYVASDSQLEKVLLSSRRALSCGDAETLQNKLRVIESFGFAKEDIADFVSRCPLIVHVKDLSRNIQSLLALFGNSESTLNAVRRCPQILAVTSDKLETQIKCLRQSGLDDPAISTLIYRCPSILHARPEKVVQNIRYLRSIGVPEDAKVFQTALTCFARGGSNPDEKERILAKAGLSEEQVKEVFRRCPMNLSKSLEKIQRVTDYLGNVAGLSPDVIVKYPFILGLSVEKRIKPRHEAFKYLSASGRKLKSLARVICLSEKQFMKKFVEGNPDADQLLKIYGSVSSANREKGAQS